MAVNNDFDLDNIDENNIVEQGVEPKHIQLRRHGSARIHDPSTFYAGLISGAASGALASITVAPLDLVRVRMQVWGQLSAQGTGSQESSQQQRHIKTMSSKRLPILQIVRDIRQREGYRGFFKGLGATLLTLPLFWAIYFPCYDYLKAFWQDQQQLQQQKQLHQLQHPQQPIQHHHPGIIHMVSAVQAGAIADVVCNPMFVVRTRLQTAALHEYQQSLQQTLHTQNQNHHPVHNTRPSAPASPSSSPPPLSIAGTISAMYKEGGLAIFWRGMTANLLGLSHVAIQFPLYEQFKAQLRENRIHHKHHKHHHHHSHSHHPKGGILAAHPSISSTSPVMDLLLASSVSKMIASFLTYPHEVIRSRMMDSRFTGIGGGGRGNGNVNNHTHSCTLSPKQPPLGFMATCSRMYRQEGLRGFYAGLPITMIRVIPNTCVTFLTYELFMQYFLSEQQPNQ